MRSPWIWALCTLHVVRVFRNSSWIVWKKRLKKREILSELQFERIVSLIKYFSNASRSIRIWVLGCL